MENEGIDSKDANALEQLTGTVADTTKSKVAAIILLDSFVGTVAIISGKNKLDNNDCIELILVMQGLIKDLKKRIKPELVTVEA